MFKKAQKAGISRTSCCGLARFFQPTAVVYLSRRPMRFSGEESTFSANLSGEGGVLQREMCESCQGGKEGVDVSCCKECEQPV
jgi:hypothetical protein